MHFMLDFQGRHCMMLAMVYTTLSMLSKLNANFIHILLLLLLLLLNFIHCNWYHQHTPSTVLQMT